MARGKTARKPFAIFERHITKCMHVTKFCNRRIELGRKLIEGKQHVYFS